MTALPGSIRVLVTGSGGMLGQDVLAALSASRPDQVSAVEVTPTTRATLDVTDLEAVRAAVAGHDVVVNCTAWTKVDDAESQEAEAFAVNATAAGYLARACAASGARLVHVSTDYVFAGDATTPYAEDAPIAPRSAYGRTKAAGEWAIRAELPDRHVILRTAWLYGAGGPNFVATMARLEGQRETLDVVDDQRGQPTWSRDLADRIADVVQVSPPAGTYHATSSGETTWCGLAREVFAALGADPERIRPTTSAAYVRPAPRPAYSVLGHDGWSRAGLPPLRDWREALAEAITSGLVVPSAS
jgi:dTDP-4-dehydrorhamnose reductase